MASPAALIPPAALVAKIDSANLTEAAQALAILKVELLNPVVAHAHGRAGLEAGVRLAVRMKDKVALDRTLLQLMPYYAAAPVSKGYEYIALQLLLFLVESRLMDFFAALELLSVEERTQQQHVRFVASLERHLTEGGYNMALRARADATSPLFAWLLEDFENTVRLHVASCLKAAFVAVSIRHATQLLNLPSEQRLREFAANQDDWVVSGDNITFINRGDGAHRHLTKDSIPAKSIISESLALAVELDKII